MILLLAGTLIAYLALAPLPPLTVSTHKARRGVISEYIEEEGRTQLGRERKIFPSMTGYLGPVTLEVGDKIQEGQLISRMDDVDIKKEMEAIRCEIKALESQIIGVDQSKPKKEEFSRERLLIEQAEQNLAIAQKDLDMQQVQFNQSDKEFQRLAQLFQHGIAPIQDQENIETKRQLAWESLDRQQKLVALMQKNITIARTNLAILHDADDDRDYLRQVYTSQIESQRARLDILQNNLKKTALVAPFAGIVLERATKGNVNLSFVTPDYYILRIGDLASLEIRVDILSDDIHKVQIGQQATIFGQALGERKLSGKVSKIYPTAFTKISSLGIEQQRVTVIVLLDSPANDSLGPEYRVDVRIFTKTAAHTVIVPSRALFAVGNRRGLFALEENRARLCLVKVGIETDEETEIVEGIQEGQAVILDPANDLKDGRTVAGK